MERSRVLRLLRTRRRRRRCVSCARQARRAARLPGRRRGPLSGHIGLVDIGLARLDPDNLALVTPASLSGYYLGLQKSSVHSRPERRSPLRADSNREDVWGACFRNLPLTRCVRLARRQHHRLRARCRGGVMATAAGRSGRTRRIRPWCATSGRRPRSARRVGRLYPRPGVSSDEPAPLALRVGQWSNPLQPSGRGLPQDFKHNELFRPRAASRPCHCRGAAGCAAGFAASGPARPPASAAFPWGRRCRSACFEQAAILSSQGAQRTARFHHMPSGGSTGPTAGRAGNAVMEEQQAARIHQKAAAPGRGKAPLLQVPVSHVWRRRGGRWRRRKQHRHPGRASAGRRTALGRAFLA